MPRPPYSDHDQTEHDTEWESRMDRNTDPDTANEMGNESSPFTPPQFTLQPESGSYEVGTLVQLQALCEIGSQPISYQWRYNVGTPLSQSPNLSFFASDSVFSGSYDCVATGPGGDTATSNAANITIFYIAPTITSDPENITVNVGESVGLSVTASGTDAGAQPLTYQWESDTGGGFAAIPGATDRTYEFTAASSAESGQYRCVVTNGGGSDTSAAAAVVVNDISAVSASGIWIQMQPNDVDDPPTYATIREEAARPGVVGLVFRILWADGEPTIGNYDDSLLNDWIAAAKDANPNIRYRIMPIMRTYNNTIPVPFEYQETAQNPAGAGMTFQDGGGWSTYIYDTDGGGVYAGVRDTLKAYFVHLATTFAPDPAFEGFHIQEAALGSVVGKGAATGAYGVPAPAYPNDGDDIARTGAYMLADFYIDLIVTTLAPLTLQRTICWFGNFMPGNFNSQDAILDVCDAMIAQNNTQGFQSLSLGGPDIIPGDDSLTANKKIYFNQRNYYHSGANLKLAMSAQNNSFIFWDNDTAQNTKHKGYPGPGDLYNAEPSPRYAWTPAEMFEYCINDLHVTDYIVNIYKGSDTGSTWNRPPDGPYVYDITRTDNVGGPITPDFANDFLPTVLGGWAVTENALESAQALDTSDWVRTGLQDVALEVRTADQYRDYNLLNGAFATEYLLEEDNSSGQHRINQVVTDAQLQSVGIEIGEECYVMVRVREHDRPAAVLEVTGLADSTTQNIRINFANGSIGGFGGTDRDRKSLHTYRNSRSNPVTGWWQVAFKVVRTGSNDVNFKLKGATGTGGGADNYQGVAGTIACGFASPILWKQRF